MKLGSVLSNDARVGIKDSEDGLEMVLSSNDTDFTLANPVDSLDAAKEKVPFEKVFAERTLEDGSLLSLMFSSIVLWYSMS